MLLSLNFEISLCASCMLNNSFSKQSNGWRGPDTGCTVSREQVTSAGEHDAI